MSEDFTTTLTVDRTPDEVYAAVLDVPGWWGDIDGSAAAVGDEFVYEVPGVHRSVIQVEELAPGEQVVWRVLENGMTFVHDQTEWVGTEIRFDIVPVDRGTQLTFTHVGLVPAYECFDICHDAWSFYIRTSLRDLVTTGVGRPGVPDEVPPPPAIVVV